MTSLAEMGTLLEPGAVLAGFHSLMKVTGTTPAENATLLCPSIFLRGLPDSINKSLPSPLHPGSHGAPAPMVCWRRASRSTMGSHHHSPWWHHPRVSRPCQKRGRSDGSKQRAGFLQILGEMASNTNMFTQLCNIVTEELDHPKYRALCREEVTT